MTALTVRCEGLPYINSDLIAGRESRHRYLRNRLLNAVDALERSQHGNKVWLICRIWKRRWWWVDQNLAKYVCIINYCHQINRASIA